MLILASASSARKRLLDKAGIPYRALVSGIDETQFCESDPKQLVMLLAKAKASSVWERCVSNGFNECPFDQETAVLGCDSVLEFQGEIFGKPRDSTEAFNRWKKMSSFDALLHTGHSLIHMNDEKLVRESIDEVISTRIYFSSLSESEIKDYVATGEPMNCAGGFAIEGRGGMFIRRLDGCYSNVIGLSLPWLKDNL